MLVSIIIPTYNRGYILERAIESVFAQTYPHCEAVVVDDGSTDDTAEVARRLSRPGLRFLRHASNRGVAAALNTGVRNAGGDLIGFLGSDDALKPQMVDRELDVFERHPEVGAVFGDVELVEGQDGTPWTTSLTRLMPKFSQCLPANRLGEELLFSPREMFLFVLEEVPVKPTVLLVRRELFDEVGLFDEDWRSGEDWEHLLRLSRVTTFAYVDEVFARQHHLADAAHRTYREEDKSSVLRLFLQERARLRADREASAALRRGIVGVSRDLGHYYRSHGRRWRAFQTYLRGARATGDSGLIVRALLAWMPQAMERRIRTIYSGNGGVPA